MSTAFARKTFQFLHAVNTHPDLTPVDLAVCMQLTRYFNENDQGGRAYPSYKTIAQVIGQSEATVIRSVHRVADTGLLKVVWGQSGRGHPNQYWMGGPTGTTSAKPAPVKVSEAGKPAPDAARKPSSRAKKTSTALKENLKEEPPESLFSPTELESVERVMMREAHHHHGPPDGVSDEGSEPVAASGVEIMPPDPALERWIGEAVAVLGAGSRGVAVDLLNAKGSLEDAVEALEVARSKRDPRSYVAAIVRHETDPNRPPPRPRQRYGYVAAAREIAANMPQTWEAWR